MTVDCSLLLWRGDARVRWACKVRECWTWALVKADRYPLWNCGDRVLVDGRHRQPAILEGLLYKDDLVWQGIQSMVRRTEVTRLAKR